MTSGIPRTATTSPLLVRSSPGTKQITGPAGGGICLAAEVDAGSLVSFDFMFIPFLSLLRT